MLHSNTNQSSPPDDSCKMDGLVYTNNHCTFVSVKLVFIDLQGTKKEILTGVLENLKETIQIYLLGKLKDLEMFAFEQSKQWSNSTNSFFLPPALTSKSNPNHGQPQ